MKKMAKTIVKQPTINKLRKAELEIELRNTMKDLSNPNNRMRTKKVLRELHGSTSGIKGNCLTCTRSCQWATEARQDKIRAKEKKYEPNPRYNVMQFPCWC